MLVRRTRAPSFVKGSEAVPTLNREGHLAMAGDNGIYALADRQEDLLLLLSAR